MIFVDFCKWLNLSTCFRYRTKLNELNTIIVSIEPAPSGAEAAVVKNKTSFKKEQDCGEIRAILDFLVDKGEGVRDYGAGLGKMKEVLGDSVLNEAHIGKSCCNYSLSTLNIFVFFYLVFIVPETNQKGIFKQMAHDLNQDARVFAVGTNKHAPMAQLVEIASLTDGTSFAIRFPKPPHVVESVKSLSK